MIERDIWATAALIIKRHGNDAEHEAALRADQLTAQGDPDGAATWKRIVSAIHELTEPSPSEMLH